MGTKTIPWISLRKMLIFMKFAWFILCCTFMTVQANVFSQRVIINANMQNVSLTAVFKELGKQAKCDFLYNHNLIKNKGTVNLVAKNKELKQILEELLPEFGLEYLWDDNVVIIREKPIEPEGKKEIRIVGKVTDQQKHPLAGVTVRLKPGQMGTSTDINGWYQIVLPKLDSITLVYSFIGMETQEIKYKGKDTINVVMKESSAMLDEVIVNTGYQQIDLRKTTSAIQSIKASDIVVAGLQSIDQMLEGYIPGMTFMQNSGQIGAAPRIRIRGTSTVLGSQEPVWVIDGIVQENPVDVDPEQINDLDFVNLVGNAISGLNPEDIEQIDVLKDASATALYGARAANGVIVITTKKGKPGPPTISYSLSGSFMRRPHYGDNSVNMMDSRERIAYSRELIEKRVPFGDLQTWMGYEKPLRDYWENKITFEEMQKEVGYYESVNTDWFDLLMRNSFTHKHTLSISGGSSSLRYYASIGFSDASGSIKGENNKSYTANINLTANYNKFTFRMGITADVGKRKYTPGDVGVTTYAYNTTRALPVYNENKELWYYQRYTSNNQPVDFNILEDVANTSQDIRSTGMTIRATVDYKILEPLKAAITGSYSTANTTQETWHGEKSFYAKSLQIQNKLPFGGELIYQNSEKYSYVIRAQLDFNKFIDSEQIHLITASAGGEISSTQYYGLNQTYRGYLRERGKKMAEITDWNQYEDFMKWRGKTSAAIGEWTDKLTNVASFYGTISYSYKNMYSLNTNIRIDASNRFGSRANEKLAPIWSVSGRWNIKESILPKANWITTLDLRASFGYQGNMLDNASAKLVIRKEGIQDTWKEFYSTVQNYPNPDLKWEKTASYNATLDFSFFKNFLRGSVSYFYKRTQDAFLTKNVSKINGLNNWTVNQGVITNQGIEVSMNFTPIDTRSVNINGFRWTFNPNIGQVVNQLVNRRSRKDRSFEQTVTYDMYLNGSADIAGRPLNSFFSYRYIGLEPENGLPIFFGSDQTTYIDGKKTDLMEKFNKTSDRQDVWQEIMVYSGSRVPDIQGGIQNTFAWRRFTMAINVAYSFGAKIRLLKMYSNVSSRYGTIAPRPTENVRREFLKRWQVPGDELRTDIPGVVSGPEFVNTLHDKVWWNNYNAKNEAGISYSFASDLWQMYDNSDLRVVNGNYVKIQSLSLRYNLSDKLCNKLNLKNCYVGFSATNLHTFCSKKLKGQDPATQNGSAPQINMSLCPTYSFNLNISF